MRCLDHVFLRGAMALALLAFGGTGALLLPQAAPPACKADAGDAPIAMSMAAADAVPSTRAPITRLAQVERAAC
jgi:hypothetical protein